MRKYGYLTEVITSIIEIISFTCLVAGNLVGTSLMINFCFNLPVWQGIIIAGARREGVGRGRMLRPCCAALRTSLRTNGVAAS